MVAYTVRQFGPMTLVAETPERRFWPRFRIARRKRRLLTDHLLATKAKTVVGNVFGVIFKVS